MRWSLILLISVTVLSTLSVALVIPPSESSVDLERHVSMKASSKKYRKNAESHPFRYKIDAVKGTMTRDKLHEDIRVAYGKRMKLAPKTDAGISWAITLNIWAAFANTLFFLLSFFFSFR